MDVFSLWCHDGHVVCVMATVLQDHGIFRRTIFFLFIHFYQYLSIFLGKWKILLKTLY